MKKIYKFKNFMFNKKKVKKGGYKFNITLRRSPPNDPKRKKQMGRKKIIAKCH
jgi:hypothetical protein